jgi:TRAP-type C4-dicarboxylate transport system permease large subunit
MSLLIRVTTPSLLFVLVAMIAGCYLVNKKNREKPFAIKGRQIPLTQQYLAVLCLCIPLLIMVGAGSAIFWILGK